MRSLIGSPAPAPNDDAQFVGLRQPNQAAKRIEASARFERYEATLQRTAELKVRSAATVLLVVLVPLPLPLPTHIARFL